MSSKWLYNYSKSWLVHLLRLSPRHNWFSRWSYDYTRSDVRKSPNVISANVLELSFPWTWFSTHFIRQLLQNTKFTARTHIKNFRDLLEPSFMTDSYSQVPKYKTWQSKDTEVAPRNVSVRPACGVPHFIQFLLLSSPRFALPHFILSERSFHYLSYVFQCRKNEKMEVHYIRPLPLHWWKSGIACNDVNLPWGVEP